MFNPNPTIRYVPIGEHQVCAIIDDFLLDPQKMLDLALSLQDQFQYDPDNYFPGPELFLSKEISISFDHFFMQYIRQALGARRNLGTSCRLSMTTSPVQQLRPFQRLCHRDNFGLPPDVSMAASVLYLFKDSTLGGTSFYKPKKSLNEIDHLLKMASTMSGDEFTGIISTEPAYMSASNEYFELVCTIPAAWNRAIFYNGAIYHSGHIERPELLSSDPSVGRLTINSFFKFRGSSAAVGS